MFVTSGVEIVDGPHALKSEHLRMTLGQGGRRFRAIAWGAGPDMGRFQSRRGGLKVAFSVTDNTYRDKTTTELTIADLQEDD